jgi:hypothetical protein
VFLQGWTTATAPEMKAMNDWQCGMLILFTGVLLLVILVCL